MSTLGPYLQVEDVVLNLQVRDKPHLFAEVGRLLERVHGLPAAAVISSLMRREQAGPTALGEGVAIPHARVRDLDRIRAAYVRLSPPIAFGAPDGRPVMDVLVLMVPGPATDLHLELLADAASLFSDPAFRDALHRCERPSEVKDAFDHWMPEPNRPEHNIRLPRRSP